METFIRDSDEHLCKVLFKTNTHYHAERVKDKVKVEVPVGLARVVTSLDKFPGDWAIEAS